MHDHCKSCFSFGCHICIPNMMWECVTATALGGQVPAKCNAQDRELLCSNLNFDCSLWSSARIPSKLKWMSFCLFPIIVSFLKMPASHLSQIIRRGLQCTGSSSLLSWLSKAEMYPGSVGCVVKGSTHICPPREHRPIGSLWQTAVTAFMRDVYGFVPLATSVNCVRFATSRCQCTLPMYESHIGFQKILS